MAIAYVPPLRSAWARMVRMLFRPFRIEVWLVLGFAAFLSEYLSWGLPGSRSSRSVRGVHWTPDREVPREAIRRVVDFLSHPLAITLIFWLALSALAAFVLLIWINSRGMFIFLDDVAHERTAIVEPWRRFRRAGNSLFLWRLGFGVVCLLIAGAMVLPFLASIGLIVHEETFDPARLFVLLPMVAMFVPFAIVAAYIHLFLTSFVVPIMYRHELGAGAAWGRFLGLFRRHPGAFILYGLFALGLTLVAGMAVFAFGMATCCVGFLILGLPYVGSVLILPLEVTARALGPEFLSQFDPDLTVLAGPASASGGAAGTAGSPPPPAGAPTS